MAKKSKNSVKSNSTIKSKTKNKMNLITIKGNRRRARKKTFYDKNEFVTDLSFIDKYEEEENERIKIKENENLINIQKNRLYYLKICFRPSTNNIELIGNYSEQNYININQLPNNNDNINNNKCSYLLMQNNKIIAPILKENYINNDKSNKKINTNENLNENDKKENIGNQKMKKKKRIKKSILKNEKKFFYLHICKRNLINCLLLNEKFIINYILIFLSGIYSGYFEELKKNNCLTLKEDSFNIFLNINNSINNDDYYGAEVLGKGKDEDGEYVIKGNMTLINNLTQYQKENNNIIDNKSDKVINFGNIFFHKIYNI